VRNVRTRPITMFSNVRVKRDKEKTVNSEVREVGPSLDTFAIHVETVLVFKDKHSRERKSERPH